MPASLMRGPLWPSLPADPTGVRESSSSAPHRPRLSRSARTFVSLAFGVPLGQLACL